MEHGGLKFNTLVSNVRVQTHLYDASGKGIASGVYNLASPGPHVLPVLQKAPSNFVGFLEIRAGDETYHLKVFSTAGPVSTAEARFASSPPLAITAAAGDSVVVSMSGLVTTTVSAPSNTNLGNIVMGYPKRTLTGVGMAPPYGAKFLFDGSHGKAAATAELNAKWHEWWRFNVTAQAAKPPSPVSFIISHDPQYLNIGDTNHVTLQMCCESTTNRWGYSDIQADSVHGDAQIHVEWIQMGRPSNSPDSIDFPDSNTQCTDNSTQTESLSGGCWNNSGVYIQSRYEVQIQSNALPPATITATHDMGSITNEVAPSSNQNKKNGIWQSYDITFRTARWTNPPWIKGAKDSLGDTNSLMTIWWNGVQTILNHKGTGAASGIANHSVEAINVTLYCL